MEMQSWKRVQHLAEEKIALAIFILMKNSLSQGLGTCGQSSWTG